MLWSLLRFAAALPLRWEKSPHRTSMGKREGEATAAAPALLTKEKSRQAIESGSTRRRRIVSRWITLVGSDGSWATAGSDCQPPDWQGS
ncbi:hypothetical protein PR202_gb11873 [Eleusine coracana subsp. coracana]|uniref:Secreted protein n=1 Tax=Eleusine coracana subsp. coracana TaxID=191504 RepID=A0AAV5EPZ1_ELECO|nr:hypothetical protein PR202_gb11873 [Eleusine coracana subsp. coracana]